MHKSKPTFRVCAEGNCCTSDVAIKALPWLHMASWVELQEREIAVPSVKQQLAAVGHLFDWLVVGQVVPINPAASEPGPRHVVRVGKTAVLEPAEAWVLWFVSPKCFGMLPAARSLPACTSSARGRCLSFGPPSPASTSILWGGIRLRAAHQ